ncbi:hypothetical protein B7P43_G12820 [Cryptotermes secundus]|uniref:RNase H type-1 domain-containing protein n=1 Tax=Cryptotermes secundus TaxID=105785 RepID=A0A2J7RD80_9NEOP|nr:hypothetical protein B7P43_G12820 [Cryptotermes secundus]
MLQHRTGSSGEILKGPVATSDPAFEISAKGRDELMVQNLPPEINLHDSNAATAALCQQLAEGKADIALIQEPWLYKGRIRGLNNTRGTVFSIIPSNNARSCVYTRNHVNALPLLELCTRNTTYPYREGRKEQIVASVYLPYDSDEPPPTKEMRAITDYCCRRKKQLIIGCDANAHHILWGSTGTKPRGESFMEFLLCSNLNILNHGNEPTFVVCNRKEVIDLTLGTNDIGNLINRSTGVGVYCYGTRRKLSFSLGQYMTVFQAEVYAIKACIMENLDRNYRNRKIYLLSDSQAALKALDKHQIKSKLVWDCHQTLMELAKHKSVQLIWVPGHEGIDGNEAAAQLAKIGAEHPFIGPEPACGMSLGVAKQAIRDWTHKNHKKY